MGKSRNLDSVSDGAVGPCDGMVAAIVVVSGRIKTQQRATEIMDLAADALTATGFSISHSAVIGEEPELLRTHFQQALEKQVQLLLTIGGTGVGRNNQVPELTAEIITTRLPGVEYAIVAKGLLSTKAAGISRGLVGLTGRDETATLIVNSPSSRGGVADVLSVVLPIVPNIFDGLRH